MSVSTVSDMERTLNIEQIASCDTFVGHPPPHAANSETRTHLFGGLIAAQSVVAACRTVPATHRIHSLHSYFILAGDGRKRILFQVTRIRDGSSFKTRQVLAIQENQPIFMMIASFHQQEPGPEFQRTGAEMAALLTLLPDDSKMKTATQMISEGAKVDQTPSTSAMNVYVGHNHSVTWRKHKTPLQDDKYGDHSWVLHAAVLAYMSDMGLLSTVRQPYQQTSISMNTSLDHTIHFHRPFRADEWLLFHNETTASSNARGVARTEVWTEEGYLVASFMQEGLVRPSRHWKPETSPADDLKAQALNMRTLMNAESKL